VRRLGRPVSAGAPGCSRSIRADRAALKSRIFDSRATIVAQLILLTRRLLFERRFLLFHFNYGLWISARLARRPDGQHVPLAEAPANGRRCPKDG
jgi:hypothetical protein